MYYSWCYITNRDRYLTQAADTANRTSLNDLLKASALYGKPVYHIPIQSVDFLKRTGNSSKYGMQ